MPLPYSETYESPTGLAGLLLSQAYTQPRTSEALDALRALQLESVGGLRTLLAEDPQAGRQAIEDAAYARSEGDLLRERDRLAREINEGTFGRGVGMGTISLDAQDRLTREHLDSLIRARREAFLSSGAEQRARRADRLAALGEGFSRGMVGLQGEAAIGASNLAREQAGRQAAAGLAFQNLQERLGREQRGTLTGEELTSRERMFGQDIGARERFQGRALGSASEELAARERMLGLDIGARERMQGRAIGSTEGMAREARSEARDRFRSSLVAQGAGGLASLFAPGINRLSERAGNWLADRFGI